MGRRMPAQPKIYRSSKDTDSIVFAVENCIESTPLMTKSFNTGPFNIAHEMGRRMPALPKFFFFIECHCSYRLCLEKLSGKHPPIAQIRQSLPLHHCPVSGPTDCSDRSAHGRTNLRTLSYSNRPRWIRIRWENCSICFTSVRFLHFFPISACCSTTKLPIEF